MLLGRRRHAPWHHVAAPVLHRFRDLGDLVVASEWAGTSTRLWASCRLVTTGLALCRDMRHARRHYADCKQGTCPSDVTDP